MTRKLSNTNYKDKDFLDENAKKAQEFRITQMTEKKYFDKGNGITGFIENDNPKIHVNTGYF